MSSELGKYLREIRRLNGFDTMHGAASRMSKISPGHSSSTLMQDWVQPFERGFASLENATAGEEPYRSFLCLYLTGICATPYQKGQIRRMVGNASFSFHFRKDYTDQRISNP